MTTATKQVLLIKRAFLNGWELSAAGEPSEGCGWGKLEVNVVFTDPEKTVAALKVAGELASDLRGKIRLLAPQVVPFGFPLDNPPVSVEFSEKPLLDLASQGAEGDVETTVHLYLCRDKLDTLGQVLKPNSLVVIGGKRWWPTDASWIARMLRAIGHNVIFVPNKAAGVAVKQRSAIFETRMSKRGIHA